MRIVNMPGNCGIYVLQDLFDQPYFLDKNEGVFLRTRNGYNLANPFEQKKILKIVEKTLRHSKERSKANLAFAILQTKEYNISTLLITLNREQMDDLKWNEILKDLPGVYIHKRQYRSKDHYDNPLTTVIIEHAPIIEWAENHLGEL